MPIDKPNMIIQRPSDFGSDKLEQEIFLMSRQSNSPSPIIMGKPGFGKTSMPPVRPMSFSRSRLIAMGCEVEEKDGYVIGTDPDGDRFFTKNNLLHREDGPALERANCQNKYALFGYFHNTSGPALTAELTANISTGEEVIHGLYYLYGEVINKYDFVIFQKLCAEDIPTYASYIAFKTGVSRIEDVRKLMSGLREVPISHLWKVTGINLEAPAGFEAIVQFEREQS